jgi:predicted transcriptional regulator
VEKRKMARPRGPHPLNYLRVLYVLLGRRVYWDLRELRAWRAGEIITPKLSFGEIVEATGLSRGIVAKILRDALMRGVVSVNYDGRRSAYFLTQPGFFIARPYQLIIRDDVAEVLVWRKLMLFMTGGLGEGRTPTSISKSYMTSL